MTIVFNLEQAEGSPWLLQCNVGPTCIPWNDQYPEYLENCRKCKLLAFC